MNIAFIGLGRMGVAMVRNLVRAGHNVIVFNRSRDKAEALRSEGVQVAESIREASDSCELCWTMLLDDAATRDIVFGSDGVADSLPVGATHISSSTITVAMGRTLTAEHTKRNQGYLSVPVFGRPDAAEAKKLIAVPAGPQELIEKHREAIDAVSRVIYVAGPEPWQANLLKLCGNFTLHVMIETFGEAFATFQKAGVDRHILFNVLMDLYASPVYKNYGNMIVNEDFQPGFALKGSLKDLRNMLLAAEDLNAPMPLASVIRDQMLSAMAHGQEEQDFTSFALVAARNAGVAPSK